MAIMLQQDSPTPHHLQSHRVRGQEVDATVGQQAGQAARWVGQPVASPVLTPSLTLRSQTLAAKMTCQPVLSYLSWVCTSVKSDLDIKFHLLK